jgi:hypothetical protein
MPYGVDFGLFPALFHESSGLASTIEKSDFLTLGRKANDQRRT